MPQSDQSNFHLRLSPALMKRIKLAAVENERSITAEISARLEGSFDLDTNERQELRSLLAGALSLVDHSPKK